MGFSGKLNFKTTIWALGMLISTGLVLISKLLQWRELGRDLDLYPYIDLCL